MGIDSIRSMEYGVPAAERHPCFFREERILKKYPHIRQQEERDCGAACLSMISAFYGLKLSISYVRELIKVDSYGSTVYGIVRGADKIHLSAHALEGSQQELLDGLTDRDVATPFIARIVNDRMFEHYIVVYKMGMTSVVISDPSEDKIKKITLNSFFDMWLGQIITFKPDPAFVSENKRKGSLSKYIRLATSQWGKISGIFLISVFLAVINIAGASVLAHLIDLIFYNHSSAVYHAFGETYSLNHLFFLILVIYLIMMAGQFFRDLIGTYLVAHVDLMISSKFFEKMGSLPLEFFERYKTGALLSRFDDVADIRNTVSTVATTTIFDILIAVITGIYLVHLNMYLFFIALSVIAVYALIIFAFRRPVKRISEELMERDASVTASLKEMIDASETIKAYNTEDKSVSVMKKLFRSFLNKDVEGSIMSGLLSTLTGVVSSAGTLLLLWSGTGLALKGSISFGVLVSFYYLLGYFFEPLQNMINLFPSLQKTIVAEERLNDIFDAEDEPDEKENGIEFDFKEGIRFQNVSFRYGYRQQILNRADFIIPKGTKAALIGSNGAGKTTVAKLLVKLYRAESGSILIDDENIENISNREVRKNIIYVPQTASLFAASVSSNLRAGNDSISDREIESTCKNCLADEFVRRLPFGYETVLEENAKNLSGGQRQRLVLARALLKKPQILILDEATSSLDEQTERAVISRICADKNLTCIIITHRKSVLEYCDLIYEIKDNKVLSNINRPT